MPVSSNAGYGHQTVAATLHVVPGGGRNEVIFVAWTRGPSFSGWLALDGLLQSFAGGRLRSASRETTGAHAPSVAALPEHYTVTTLTI